MMSFEDQIKTVRRNISLAPYWGDHNLVQWEKVHVREQRRRWRLLRRLRLLAGMRVGPV